jgi:hypothetical protein
MVKAAMVKISCTMLAAATTVARPTASSQAQPHGATWRQRASSSRRTLVIARVRAISVRAKVAFVEALGGALLSEVRP